MEITVTLKLTINENHRRIIDSVVIYYFKVKELRDKGDKKGAMKMVGKEGYKENFYREKDWEMMDIYVSTFCGEIMKISKIDVAKVLYNIIDNKDCMLYWLSLIR